MENSKSSNSRDVGPKAPLAFDVKRQMPTLGWNHASHNAGPKAPLAPTHHKFRKFHKHEPCSLTTNFLKLP